MSEREKIIFKKLVEFLDKHDFGYRVEERDLIEEKIIFLKFF